MKRPKELTTVGQAREVFNTLLSKLEPYDDDDELRYVRLDVLLFIDGDFWDGVEDDVEDDEDDDDDEEEEE